MEFGQSVPLGEHHSGKLALVPEQVPLWHPSRVRDVSNHDRELSAEDLAHLTREQFKQIARCTVRFASFGAEPIDAFDAAVKEVTGKSQNPMLSRSLMQMIFNL